MDTLKYSTTDEKYLSHQKSPDQLEDWVKQDHKCNQPALSVQTNQGQIPQVYAPHFQVTQSTAYDIPTNYMIRSKHTWIQIITIMKVFKPKG